MQAQLEQTSSATANADIFLVTTSNGSVRQVFPLAEQLIGLPAEVILGINAFTFFHVDDVPMIMSIISETMTRGRESRAVELRIRREGDSWRAVTLSASRDQPDSDTLGIAFRLRGPATSVQAADQIARLALHDRVTDLPNRALFVDRIDHAFVRAARRSQSVIVLVVGFNGYGAAVAGERHDVDDNLVVAVTRRLRSCVRASDNVARLSHDEYGILLEDVSDSHGVKAVVDRIFRVMEAPFDDGDDERAVAVSIGAAASMPEHHRAVDLLRAASIARAWASVQGPGGYAQYDPTMSPPEGDDATSQYELSAMESAALKRFVAETRDADLSDLQQRVDRLEHVVAKFARLTGAPDP